MTFFGKIKHVIKSQRFLFYVFLVVLIVPNIFLIITEPLSFWGKVCNVLLPLAFYALLFTFSRKPGIILWVLFPFIFLGAFQLVLLNLFGESIIAVDMFLNLVTTNTGEAMELLDNLIPALIGVFLLYIPTLAAGVMSIRNKQKLDNEFLLRNRKYASIALFTALLCMAICYKTDKKYKAEIDLFPVNVCYNAYLAHERDVKTQHYYETSKNFKFNAKVGDSLTTKEIYVMVIGEASRAFDWSLYGYPRNTNPMLSKVNDIIVFKDDLTQSNTTHKSVPILLSNASAQDYECIYKQKGLITAFKEAGFHTAFFSNQRYNHAFIDFFGKEADVWYFIKEQGNNPNAMDEELLQRLEKEIGKGYAKLFVVLHTYGSHFNYKERYKPENAFFKPDNISGASPKYRQGLINAYDNSIRSTDKFLSDIIHLLQKQQQTASAILYTSDHGEDIYDDERKLFLHASPLPSYYQLHVPFILWFSPQYKQQKPQVVEAAVNNKNKPISSNCVFHTMLNMGGIVTSYRNDSLSVVNRAFQERKRFYLDDHNNPKSLMEIRLKEQDFEMFNKMKIKY